MLIVGNEGVIGRGNAGNCISLVGIIVGWIDRQKAGSLRPRIPLGVSAASGASLIIEFIVVYLVHR